MSDPSAYDPFALIYHRHWARRFHPLALAVVERWLLPRLARRAAILDLCCGTGEMAGALAEQGYRVTGIDGSEAMLGWARRIAPGATFRQADARQFTLARPVDAALSLFDSLNHIVEPEGLAAAFRCVRAALKPGAPFLFDMNTEAAYGDAWDDSVATVEADHAFFLRGGFDARTRLGETRVTAFFAEGELWRRRDFSIWQRCYSAGEIEAALREAGFDDVTAIAGTELGESLPVDEPELANGRIFWLVS